MGRTTQLRSGRAIQKGNCITIDASQLLTIGDCGAVFTAEIQLILSKSNNYYEKHGICRSSEDKIKGHL